MNILEEITDGIGHIDGLVVDVDRIGGFAVGIGNVENNLICAVRGNRLPLLGHPQRRVGGIVIGGIAEVGRRNDRVGIGSMILNLCRKIGIDRKTADGIQIADRYLNVFRMRVVCDAARERCALRLQSRRGRIGGQGPRNNIGYRDAAGLADGGLAAACDTAAYIDTAGGIQQRGQQGVGDTQLLLCAVVDADPQLGGNIREDLPLILYAVRIGLCGQYGAVILGQRQGGYRLSVMRDAHPQLGVGRDRRQRAGQQCHPERQAEQQTEQPLRSKPGGASCGMSAAVMLSFHTENRPFPE